MPNQDNNQFFTTEESEAIAKPDQATDRRDPQPKY